jgi:hypothetical protein
VSGTEGKDFTGACAQQQSYERIGKFASVLNKSFFAH